MTRKENLWSAEFLKKNFAEKVELREWITGIAMRLYPELANEFLLQLLQSEELEERRVGFYKARNLTDFSPLAIAMKELLKSNEKLSWEAYEFLARYAPEGVSPLLSDGEDFYPLKEENDLFYFVSLCRHTLPRNEAYENIVAQYERLREKDYRREYLLRDIINTSPAGKLSKWFTLAIGTRSLNGLHQLVSREHLYDSLSWENIEDDSKARDLAYFTHLQEYLSKYVTPHKLSEELLERLVARPRESARIFQEELERLAQQRQWNLASWQQKHEASEALEEYQRKVLLSLEILKYYQTRKDSGKQLIGAYMVFNAAASHRDERLLDSVPDKAAHAFELLSENRLNLPDFYIDALVAAAPELYEDKLFAIIEEDKRFIAIENVMKVFKKWALLKPQECFASADRLIACLHSDQSDEVCEGISRCLSYLGPRVLGSIKKVFNKSENKCYTQQIYLQSALRRLPHRETLEYLLQSFEDIEYLTEDQADLLGKFLHPDLLPILEGTELETDTAQLICHICNLYEMTHPLLSEAREIVKEEKERRANFVSPLDRLLQMSQKNKLPSFG